MLNDKIIRRVPGILLYGITPPKQEYTYEKINEIAQKQLDRINQLEIDGLILYDIQDESDRTDKERPFPFLATIDPEEYRLKFLSSFDKPAILYKCVGKYTEVEFKKWLQKPDGPNYRYSVFVGAASKAQSVNLTIKHAYELKKTFSNDILLGGVTIPERHTKKNNEHFRVQDKITNGCQFFVSQAVYDVNASKNLVSDIYYHFHENQLEIVPLIFTLTPCGSLKTLSFMEWLGISIPKWLVNELKYSGDILKKSMEICYSIAEELVEFCSEKNIPIGFNIESVAIRKTEIDASIDLLNKIKILLNRKFQGC